MWSGTVATAGDVVFYGTMDGWFKAVDARTGAELWKYRTASGVIGQPVSYCRGPNRLFLARVALGSALLSLLALLMLWLPQWLLSPCQS